MEIRNKSKRTATLISAAIALCLFACVALVCGMQSLTAHAAPAISGPIIDYTVTPTYTVAMDINGKPGFTTESGYEDFSNANNASVLYRTRTINVEAIIPVASDSLPDPNKYRLRDGAEYRNIYNNTEEYFTVEGGRSQGNGTNAYFSEIKLVAKKSTTSLREGAEPRFVLILEHSETKEQLRLTYVVSISANFVAEDLTTDYYVGRQVKSDYLVEISTADDDTSFVDIPIKLTNYQTTEIDLRDYLVRRKLYKNDPGDVDARTDMASGNETTAGVLKDNNTSQYLVLNDISNYKISDKPVEGVITANNVRLYANDRLAFSVTLAIEARDLQISANTKGGKLWIEDNVYWDLPVKLDIGNGKSVTVKIPVVFVPDTKPKTLGNFQMDTELNAGSAYSYVDKSTPASSTGFKKVRIYPQYICDFATYANNDMWFEAEVMPELQSSNKNIVTVTVGEDSKGAIYFEVEGIGNGTADYEFTVYYNNDKLPAEERSGKTLVVPISFSVYGNYSVAFNILGNKTRTFSIDSPSFTNLRNDGYQIVSAVLVPLREDDDTRYATVTPSNGVITITPHSDIAYSTIAAIDVDLVDIKGHYITLRCPITIDMSANDSIGNLRAWEQALVWIAISVGLALLILLIVWLILRSLHRRKLDELEVSAPTSSYIIKLNSTIAAAKPQQQVVVQQQAAAPVAPPINPMPSGPALGAGVNMANALGAGGQAADPNASPALGLGVAPPDSSSSTSSYSATSEPQSYSGTRDMNNPPPAQQEEEIYIPISDEELLDRIYEEKFEPRGMLRRTFDKSKDLQKRELEREKERIRECVRNGMTIQEACKSERQRETEATLTAEKTKAAEEGPKVDPLIAALGFDPNEPIVPDVKPFEESPEWSPEVKKVKTAEYNNQRVHAELSLIESRLAAIGSAVEKTESDIDTANTSVDILSDTIKDMERARDDKSANLATERRKAVKESLDKEIADLEKKIRKEKDTLTGRKNEVESLNTLLGKIKAASGDYANKKEATEAIVAASDIELESAREELRKMEELAARAKAQAELKAKIETLTPMLQTVNKLNDEIGDLTAEIENCNSEIATRKTRVQTLQNELMSITDAAKIAEISAQIKDLNKEISDINRKSTANTTLKTEKNIEMTAARRKANEFCEKEELEVEDIIKAEDAVIGQIALDKLRAKTAAEKLEAEAEVAHWHDEVDSLTSNLDVMVAEAAADVARRVEEAEAALTEAQQRAVEIEINLSTAEDEEEIAALTEQQEALKEELATLTAASEELRADGIKANLEFRQRGEAEIENAREELANAQEKFEKLTKRYDDASTNIDPLDLIASGTGLISEDRKKAEAENYKKKLKESESALEQSRLQAQIAQQEAEKAVADAQRASEESKAEAERIAQEALQRAEAAKEEAEQRARDDAERARLEAEEFKRQAEEEIERAKHEAEEARKAAEEEAERARLEAEEAAERARLEAEEAAERARLEAEEAKKAAEEEAERARKEAEEEAERARQEAEEAKKAAEEEAERARQEAEEEAERVRKEAEEAERARQEAEEAQRLADEEAQRLAEEEAQKQAEEEAKRKAIIDEKVAKRKAQVAELRAELEKVTEEEQGTALREKFYQLQLSLDEDEKSSSELMDLLNKSMDDASHAAELSRYKKLANQKPKRIVKKVTERVNRVPKKKKKGASGKKRPPSKGGAHASGKKRPPSKGGAHASGKRPPSKGGKRPSSGKRPPSGKRPR